MSRALCIVLIVAVSKSFVVLGRQNPKNLAAPAGVQFSAAVFDTQSRPLAAARVVLERKDTGGPDIHAVTDEQGRAAVSVVAQGLYTIRIDKEGFDHPIYSIEMTPLAVQQPVRFVLPRLCVISGIVTDLEGAPLRGSKVMVLRKLAAGGLIRQGPAGVTDDRGRFRIYNLPPGCYTLAATPKPKNSNTLVLSTYYGNTANRESARFLVLGEGDQLGDISLVLEPPVKAETIQGKLVDMQGAVTKSAFAVSLIAINSASAESVTATTAADGSFSFSDVAAGEYLIYAYGPVLGTGPFGPYAGSERQEGTKKMLVTSADMDHVEVPLGSGVSVEVVGSFPNAVSGPCAQTAPKLSATLWSNELNPVRVNASPHSCSWLFRAVTPGMYKITVPPLKSGLVLTGMQVDRHPVPDGDLSVEHDTQVLLAFDNGSADIEGHVLLDNSNSAPISEGSIVLLEPEGSLSAAIPARIALIDHDGKFTLTRIPPGKYLLRDAGTSAGTDSCEGCQSCPKTGQIVTVSAGGHLNMDLHRN